MNNTVKKKVKKNRIHLKTKDYLPHAKLYPSTDLVQFHDIVFTFFGLYTVFTMFIGFLTFWPEYHCRDFSSRGAHLVHQDWYRVGYAFKDFRKWG
jgi:hypothetical protein